MHNILTINTGSSSIKLALFSVEKNKLTPLYKAFADKLTKPHQLQITSEEGFAKILKFPASSTDDHFYSAAISVLLDWLADKDIHIEAVSHRVVHGGIYYDKPVRIDHNVINRLSLLIPLAPLHQPYNLQGISQAQQRLPKCPHFACFDTAFHHTMPEINRYYAIPKEWEREGVRRYGFHGLSYAFIQTQLEKLAPKIAKKKVIMAHLGQGASLCALDKGKSVLTSMGFTALDGLIMGTRSGSIDPGVLLYWMQEKHFTPEMISSVLYNHSGLLGISGLSSDMRILLNSKEANAKLAINMFVQRINQQIGSLTAELGGLDALVFTAGIGERSAPIREAIAKLTQWLGIKIDAKANKENKLKISSAKSKVAVYVIPTNEEYMLAHYAQQLLK